MQINPLSVVNTTLPKITLQKLPPDIQNCIAPCLDGNSLSSLFQTCKGWHSNKKRIFELIAKQSKFTQNKDEKTWYLNCLTRLNWMANQYTDKVVEFDRPCKFYKLAYKNNNIELKYLPSGKDFPISDEYTYGYNWDIISNSFASFSQMKKPTKCVDFISGTSCIYLNNLIVDPLLPEPMYEFQILEQSNLKSLHNLHSFTYTENNLNEKINLFLNNTNFKDDNHGFGDHHRVSLFNYKKQLFVDAIKPNKLRIIGRNRQSYCDFVSDRKIRLITERYFQNNAFWVIEDYSNINQPNYQIISFKSPTNQANHVCNPLEIQWSISIGKNFKYLSDNINNHFFIVKKSDELFTLYDFANGNQITNFKLPENEQFYCNLKAMYYLDADGRFHIRDYSFKEIKSNEAPQKLQQKDSAAKSAQTNESKEIKNKPKDPPKKITAKKDNGVVQVSVKPATNRFYAMLQKIYSFAAKIFVFIKDSIKKISYSIKEKAANIWNRIPSFKRRVIPLRH